MKPPKPMKPLTYQYDFEINPDGRLRGLRLGGEKPDPFLFQIRLDQAFRDPVWRRLPAPVQDLLDIVQVVLAVDRLSRRRPNCDGYGWGRRLNVALPVRDPDFWKQQQ